MVTREEYEQRNSLSLKDKIDLTSERIEKWYDHWNGKIYVAFSGGKDSTVLLSIVRSLFPEIPAVFCDTGLEYPEIKEFVKSQENVTILRPKLSFRQVIEKYGYPIISKEQSRFLFEYRTTKSDKLKDIRLNGNRWGMGKISKKWRFLLDAPFSISHKCCDILKKNPAKKYEKETGNKPMMGTLVDESEMRLTTYMKYGCNMYDVTRPMSTPLAFWNEKDIWTFLREYNIPYSSIYDKGYDRTGCMFCMFGVQREGNPNRFQKMAETHPKLHDYCIQSLGLGDVLDYISVEY
jgi:3'-phosphoadenosine 5'-phosphosulfate sulfotransferase (PAPS reductase)/FAD synthetase